MFLQFPKLHYISIKCAVFNRISLLFLACIRKSNVVTPNLSCPPLMICNNFQLVATNYKMQNMLTKYSICLKHGTCACDYQFLTLIIYDFLPFSLVIRECTNSIENNCFFLSHLLTTKAQFVSSSIFQVYTILTRTSIGYDRHLKSSILRVMKSY